MMDTHIKNDSNNPNNHWDEHEFCKHCQDILENNNGDLVCSSCDKCIYCGEMLNECDCIDG